MVSISSFSNNKQIELPLQQKSSSVPNTDAAGSAEKTSENTYTPDSNAFGTVAYAKGKPVQTPKPVIVSPSTSAGSANSGGSVYATGSAGSAGSAGSTDNFRRLNAEAGGLRNGEEKEISNLVNQKIDSVKKTVTKLISEINNMDIPKSKKDVANEIRNGLQEIMLQISYYNGQNDLMRQENNHNMSIINNFNFNSEDEYEEGYAYNAAKDLFQNVLAQKELLSKLEGMETALYSYSRMTLLLN